MLKNVRKSKILLSLIAIILMVVLFGSVCSFATEPSSSSPITITATTQNTTSNNTTNNAVANNTTNTANNTANVSTISATTNNTANNAVNNTANNVSTYNNTNSTTNTSSLPYTGTNSTAILLVVAFALSAVYAYKKVSDYNV